MCIFSVSHRHYVSAEIFNCESITHEYHRNGFTDHILMSKSLHTIQFIETFVGLRTVTEGTVKFRQHLKWCSLKQLRDELASEIAC